MTASMIRIPLNDLWHIRCSDGELVDLASQAVQLPHTWNAEDGTTSEYIRGAWSYEREWTPDPSLQGMAIYLEVEAANSIATISLNGHTLLTHRGGYSRFRVDLSRHIVWDAVNVIAVLVDNSDIEEIYPLVADFTFFGGLYRGVNLVAAPDCHFDLSDHGSSGVYVSQMAVSRELATLRCEAKVVNRGAKRSDLRCQVRVLDHAGQLVVQDVQEAVVSASTSFVHDVMIAKPHLWQGVDDPYLYTVEVTLLLDGQVTDQRVIPQGLRYFRTDPRKGFFLNGVSTPLRGVSRHQDRAGKGWAISRADMEEDLAIIREMGANTIRLAHYQHDDYFYELCDRAGIVVWAEIPLITRPSKTDPTGENAVSQLVELIRQNYNHTCICFWGVQNEITVMPSTPALLALVKRLHVIAKREDPWRLTTQAQVGHHPDKDPMNPVTDTLGYNKYFGWYYDQAEDFEKWIRAFHKAQPDISLGISEYGCEGILRWHSETPKIKDYTEEYHAIYHETVYGIFAKHPELWGTWVWNMFDFASSIRDEGGVQGMNSKGLVTFDRSTRKDAFYFYQATWSKQPMLHVCSKRFVERTRAVIDVKVYSNQRKVTLQIGGREMRAKTDGAVAVFRKVPLTMGENQIVVRADSSAGELKDVLIVQRVETATVDYTCPEQQSGSNAANWFDTTELATDIKPLQFPEGFLSIRDTVGDILTVPQGEAVLRHYLEPMFRHPMFKMAKNFSLEMIATVESATFTPVLLYHVNTALNAVAKPPGFGSKR